MSNEPQRSVVFVQYAGDYAEAQRRLSSGGAENYYAQRYSIDAVAALAGPDCTVATICCTADRNEDAMLENGVRAINLRSPNGVSEQRVWEAIRACRATHLCLRTPLQRVLGRALRDDSIQSVLLTLADSFNGVRLRDRWRYWKLRRLLNHPKVVAIGNHGVNSSESLRRIGVDPGRIIPWDWPHAVSPHQFALKEAPGGPSRSVLFVGALTESKGIGDVMRAVRLLKDTGLRIVFSYAGRGEADKYAELAKSLEIGDQVTSLGLVPHSSVIGLMRNADLIIVPSRHDYPEGFPMTIYEALSSRTPIVASDHPMYAGHLRRNQAAIVYEAGSHEALAAAIRSVWHDAALYRSLSAASAAAWDALQLPVTWGGLVEGWLSQRPGRPLELGKYALKPPASLAA